MGLRLEKDLKKLLYSINDRPLEREDELSPKQIESSLFKHGSAVFPFLIAEAKTSKSTENFDDMEKQTGPVVYDSLKLQQQLKTSCDSGICYESPLVWIICYKGSFWRVAAGYIDPTRGDNTCVGASQIKGKH
jgi:hypothetical protein